MLVNIVGMARHGKDRLWICNHIWKLITKSGRTAMISNLVHPLSPWQWLFFRETVRSKPMKSKQ